MAGSRKAESYRLDNQKQSRCGRTRLRHIAALMAEPGAHTRFQAGVQAAVRTRTRP
jgi:hypothetical protein